MEKVIFKRASYDYKILKPILSEMIGILADGLIQKGTRVLIKPNLLLPAKPEKAVLTHPLVLRGVAEYVLEKGGQPLIADSPAMGPFERILKQGGYRRAFENLDVEFRAFGTSVKTDIGKPFGEIDIAKEAAETDIIINLPKLKTHAQMLFTLGVKNLFGCIVGMKKPEWHLRTGVDRERFAELLVRIHQAVNPSLTIIDGILAMEGQGPGKGGIPRHLGVLAGSRHAPSADMAICQMLETDPDMLPTHKAAKALGLIGDDVTVIGDFYQVRDFRLPVLTQLTLGPGPLRRFMRKHMIQRPLADHHACKQCGECSKYCPAKAVFPGEKQIQFDYDKCIRCYCCVEICPHGALRAAETLPGKVMRLMKFEV
ncbi:DUF362 domain-containing protein [Desulfococcaceae bacterium HSG8]|nr:DUF362 domain-containing protein [Desulfococcaceae bacterium HSG8]